MIEFSIEIVSAFLVGLIALFEFATWYADSDVKLLTEQNRILENHQRTLEKIEQRLEVIQHK